MASSFFTESRSKPQAIAFLILLFHPNLKTIPFSSLRILGPLSVCSFFSSSFRILGLLSSPRLSESLGPFLFVLSSPRLSESLGSFLLLVFPNPWAAFCPSVLFSPRLSESLGFAPESLRLMEAVEGLASRKTGIQFVPEFDLIFTIAPAEVDQAVFVPAIKIDQSGCRVFQLDAKL